jgi:Flp pilus assembly protein TadD
VSQEIGCRVCLARSLLPVLAVAITLQGCTRQYDTFGSPLTQSDIRFQAGADRPPMPNTLYAMARVFGKQGKEAQYHLMLIRTIQRHPDFAPPYSDLAELYLRRCSVEDAIRILSTGISANPNTPTLFNNLGICRLLQKNYAGALVNFTDAASLAPLNRRYRSNMAVALALMDRREEALALFMQVGPSEDAHHNLDVLGKATGTEPSGAAQEESVAEQPSNRSGPLEKVGATSE